eukprot:SAG25_NODE_5204_length_688_cov_2.288625_2_plen_69_part_01
MLQAQENKSGCWCTYSAHPYHKGLGEGGRTTIGGVHVQLEWGGGPTTMSSCAVSTVTAIAKDGGRRGKE